MREGVRPAVLHPRDRAQQSYLLGAGSTCAIVDPARDVERYLDAAGELDLAITHVLETHLHADFVSGHMELAGTTGATICAPASGRCEFEHVAVGDGSQIELEELRVDVLDTPGHTPDGVTYVVTDTARGDEPVAAFTGDALFVGDVGRPDLFPGRSRELASQPLRQPAPRRSSPSPTPASSSRPTAPAPSAAGPWVRCGSRRSGTSDGSTEPCSTRAARSSCSP